MTSELQTTSVNEKAKSKAQTISEDRQTKIEGLKTNLSTELGSLEKKNESVLIVFFVLLFLLFAFFLYLFVYKGFSEITTEKGAYAVQAAVITNFFTILLFILNRIVYDPMKTEKIKNQIAAESILAIEDVKKLNNEELENLKSNLSIQLADDVGKLKLENDKIVAGFSLVLQKGLEEYKLTLQKDMEEYKLTLQKDMAEHQIIMRNVEKRLINRETQLKEHLKLLESSNKAITEIILALKRNDFIDSLVTNIPEVQKYHSNPVDSSDLIDKEIEMLNNSKEIVKDFIHELKSFDMSDIEILEKFLLQLQNHEQVLRIYIRDMYKSHIKNQT